MEKDIHIDEGLFLGWFGPFTSPLSESKVIKMRIEINKKQMLDALKNVELKGKWSSVSGLSSKGIGNYVQFRIVNNSLLLCNSDESTTAVKAINVETEDAGSFVVEIETVRKYLSKMGDELKIVADDTVVITSEGKKATMPIVVRHPYEGRIERFLEYWPFNFNAEMDGLLKFGSVHIDAGIQITGTHLKEAITACEVVNNGIYKLNYICGDEVVNDKLVLSSNKQISSYEEDVLISRSTGESSTVSFSGPLHKFFNDDEIINMYIGDDQPILMIGNSNSAIVRAPRLDV